MATKYRFEYQPIPRKDGSQGLRVQTVVFKYCPLNCCALCQRLGGDSVVRERNDVYGWNRLALGDDGRNDESLGVLCTSCWAQIAPLVRRWKLNQEIGYLARKLDRERAIRGKQVRQTERQPFAGCRAGEGRHTFAREGVVDIETREPGECLARGGTEMPSRGEDHSVGRAFGGFCAGYRGHEERNRRQIDAGRLDTSNG